MNMRSLVLTYLASLTAFLTLDFAWLGFVARGFYRDQMGHLMRTDVRWLPAFAFYALFVGAILVFVVLPAVERGSLARADAHRDDGVLAASAFELVERGRRELGARAAERMTERYSASVWIDKLRVIGDAKLPERRETLRGKGFV